MFNKNKKILISNFFIWRMKFFFNEEDILSVYDNEAGVLYIIITSICD